MTSLIAPPQSTQLPYLWVTGLDTRRLPVGSTVKHRYTVIAPQIWQDTQPSHPPAVPSAQVPPQAIAYLRLHAHRLHLPELHDIWLDSDTPSRSILLLSNIPVDRAGQLRPSLSSAWMGAPVVRQVYWLWQMAQLWEPLRQEGVATSLLHPENIRVEGWCVRLRELLPDPASEPSDEGTQSPSISALANLWLPWISRAKPSIAKPLQEICQLLQTGESPTEDALIRLNHLLLAQAAQPPLHLSLVGTTLTGPTQSHNEDACYPQTLGGAPLSLVEAELEQDGVFPHLGVVCDGIGGHAGGEVASQLAVRSLKLQMRALLSDLLEQTPPEVVPPEIICQQIEAAIRVVNNLVAAQNDAQGRTARQRMASTLTMALHFPQPIATATGVANSHELYIASVGDSRAYWLTSDACHMLTVDDDVATREVLLGRSLYREALRRDDSPALTQAIGAREGDRLRPRVRRFVIEEDGILLLCSDGLSDHQLVEQYWLSLTRPVLAGQQSLESALEAWVELARQQNGHDDISVVLMRCRVADEATEVTSDELDGEMPTLETEQGDRPTTDPATPEATETPVDPFATESPTELSEASRSLLYDTETWSENGDALADGADPQLTSAVEEEPENLWSTWMIAVTVIVLMFCLGAVSITLWSQVSPDSFNRTWERLTN
ncbi:MAG: protein phosphatase 2C domain-containing protein [Synechococcales bacterium]|nr:protein phosphatase 2C domain-containing protein [Synechococcales bacterium]